MIATGVAAAPYFGPGARLVAADPEPESYFVLVLLAVDIPALPFFAGALVEGAGVKLLYLSSVGDDVFV